MVGWAVIAALVRSMIVEVPGVLVEDLRGVVFVVDENFVGALGPDAADEPFGVAVGSWLQPVQGDGVDMKQVAGQDPVRLGTKELGPGGSGLAG